MTITKSKIQKLQNKKLVPFIFYLRNGQTFTSDFLKVLIMNRSSWDRKKTLPLFPGEESSLRASFPQMDIM